MASLQACVAVRAARDGDAALAQAVVRSLSPRARYQRFFGPIDELPADMLRRLARFDPRQAVTLYAVAVGAPDGAPVVGIGEYVVDGPPRQAEFALAVADDWRRAGVGARLLGQLVETARAAGIDRLEGDILADNTPMLRLARKAGFALHTPPGAAIWRRATMALQPVGDRPRHGTCLQTKLVHMEAR